VPDTLVVQMILDFIRAQGKQGIILDGFPRTMPRQRNSTPISRSWDRLLIA